MEEKNQNQEQGLTTEEVKAQIAEVSPMQKRIVRKSAKKARAAS